MKKIFLIIFIVINFIALFTSCKKATDIDMVFVKGGIFEMGSIDVDSEEDEQPLTQIVVKDFYIGKYEITQKEWSAVMKKNPSYFKGKNRPVECVSWYDVQKFIENLNAKTGKHYRLPTEAEWEYAARGGNKSKGYKYSGSNNPNEVAWYRRNSYNKTQPIGSKEPNELGIYDMSGNVYEWCYDWYNSNYTSSLENNSEEVSYSERVFRGGSWYKNTSFSRVTNRGSTAPKNYSSYIGFRLVLSAEF